MTGCMHVFENKQWRPVTPADLAGGGGGGAVTTTQLPSTIGDKPRATSLSVVSASDGFEVVGIGANPTVSMTRPGDTNPYTAGDLVGQFTSAASCSGLVLTVARAANKSVMLRRMRLHKTGTSLTNASFRVHLHQPGALTFTNGDNGVWLTNLSAGYIGAFDITCDRAFTDGAVGVGVPVVGGDITVIPSGGNSYILASIEARGNYTPISGETFTVTLDALQN